MISASGRYVIAFNGEIYNHQDLRIQLAKCQSQPLEWKGHSDTETLLACIEKWGLEETLKKARGMFAVALWDREDRALFLARDRMGEKPSYYGWQQGAFLFGSELKAVKAHPSFVSEIDRNAIALQLRHNYIPAPYCIYKGIRKLLPGTFLKLPMGRGGTSAGMFPEPASYWSLKEVASAGQKSPHDWGDEEAVIELEKLLRDSVRQQMVADVPLGAFLSGGVDSSTIVALMQAQSDRPVRTFTVGFNESDYNEADYAKAVARHLGTDHTELYVSPQQALGVIPRMPVLYDEPFSDSSQIPTFLVSQLTRRHVTVSLSGDAGDELWGGYGRYFLAKRVWSGISKIPGFARPFFAGAMRSLSVKTWDSLWQSLSPALPSRMQETFSGDRMHKLATLFVASRPEDLYQDLICHWRCPSDLVVGATGSAMLADHIAWPELADFEHRMMYLDAMSYLPDDILVKVDRAAMGVSLETRMPFLDHRVVEFAWRLPLSMKIRNG